MLVLFIWILTVVSAKPCLSGRNLIGAYNPQCEDDKWRPVQCWGSTGACWCVDSEGNKIDKTPVFHQNKLSCL